jgi:predicted metallo-beta-lactamase superfamily hydrolase
MNVTILGTESLGVRGLSCAVEVRGRKVVIDPGVALGFQRNGLLPHPAQVAVGEQIRWKIAAAMRTRSPRYSAQFASGARGQMDFLITWLLGEKR